MFQQFVIFSCWICLFNQSYAIDWCSCNDDCLDGLLHCLLKTFDLQGQHKTPKRASSNHSCPDLHDWPDQLNLRLHCAKEAYCTPKPLDILDSKLRLINNFAECMETIPGVQKFEVEARFHFQLQTMQKIEEYKCRRALVEGLPDELKVWWSILLQTSLTQKTFLKAFSLYLSGNKCKL